VQYQHACHELQLYRDMYNGEREPAMQWAVYRVAPLDTRYLTCLL